LTQNAKDSKVLQLRSSHNCGFLLFRYVCALAFTS
jgi:hypothetical protein